MARAKEGRAGQGQGVPTFRCRKGGCAAIDDAACSRPIEMLDGGVRASGVKMVAGCGGC